MNADIAARFAAGDEDALAAAYKQLGPLVHTLAWRSLGNVQDAEDVTQQVFLAAWRGRAGYRSERGTLTGWIVGITRHVIVDALAGRTRRTDTERAVARRQEDAIRHFSSDESELALNRVMVLQKLTFLSPVQRRLVGMTIYGDMTQAQIAHETGLPLGTVKSHIRRGILTLRRVMETSG
ncbi:RNA polymerase sigma factor [Streptomyces sp. E-08]|uniref:RNA polymerase sigma factor n=1 Tax=Streptomyces sp. E-08 TaxID=3404047 RepID=UPI003CF02A02